MSPPDQFAFFPNLHETTADASFHSGVAPDGYLLSPVYATQAKRERAGALAGSGVEILADNGNFTLMGLALEQFQAQLDTSLPTITSRTQSPLVDLDVADLNDKEAADLRELARDLRDDVLARLPPVDRRQANQLKMHASAFIGAEDPTVALWLRADLEPNLLPFPRAYYRNLNRQVCAASVRELATAPAEISDRLLTVLSANSFDSAVDAGREAAAAGLRNIAVGFGAYMADRNYIGRVKIGGRWKVLESRLAAKYVRTLLVARGIQRGYVEVAGRAPERLHCLGLGAPVMLALVAVLSGDCKRVTFDATSPIVDAANGTLYTEKDAYLKIRTKAVVDTLLADWRRTWTCPCPFCRGFLAESPLASGSVRSRLGRAPATVADLRPGGRLYESMLLFAEPTQQPNRGRVSRARAGHNHWVLNRVCERVSTAHRAGTQDAFAGRVIADYVQRSDSSPASGAVTVGWRLAAHL